MIPIAIWDEDLIENERRRLADTIVKLPAKSSFALRVGNGWGKPNLALVNTTKEHLEQHVTTDSKMFFEILKLSTYFLQKSVQECKDDQQYQHGAAILWLAMKVLNVR